MPNASIKNDSGATFNIKSDGLIDKNSGTTSVTNAGSMVKSVTTGTTFIETAFTNTGTVSVQTGILQLDAGGSSSATSAATGVVVVASPDPVVVTVGDIACAPGNHDCADGDDWIVARRRIARHRQ